MTRTQERLFPALLRYFRTSAGLSQLDLAVAADVSARHLSFLETGRAQPSREMILRLAATLSVPLREQNAMLAAAGFAREFAEPSFDGELPKEVARAVERMLGTHEPYPLTVLDRHYDIVAVNQGGARLLAHFVADHSALPARINVFALLFDPRLLRPFVLDWAHVARGMVARLHREALAHGHDAGRAALLGSLFAYPDVPQSWRQPDFSTPSEATLVVRLRRDALEVGFLTTVTSFSAPGNVTLEELRIESYYPLDDASARTCERLARG